MWSLEIIFAEPIFFITEAVYQAPKGKVVHLLPLPKIIVKEKQICVSS